MKRRGALPMWLRLLLWNGAAFGLLAGGLWLSAQAAAQGDDDRVVVLTSYSEEVSTRYQAAFERAYPGKRVEVLWRQSADALNYLRDGGVKEVDVYWTPSPGNFTLLRNEGKFAKLALDPAQNDEKALPRDIGGFAISDPDGYFAAFELAGYGIAYNADAVAALGIAPPRDWADLAAPAYAGKVVMPIPSQVGFAPVLIDAVLQAYGWERGWAVLAEVAGNADFDRSATRHSQEPVAAGSKAARMTMDFFLSFAAETASGKPLRFVYPPKTVFNPAQVAIFADARHPRTANEFVNFVLSRDGQKLLAHPDVHRLPVREELYRDASLSLPANPFASGFGFDGELSRARDGLVAALFDIELVERHEELTALWRALHAAEQAGQGDAPEIAEARALLTRMPIDAREQQDAALRRAFAYERRQPYADLIEKTRFQSARKQLEQQWVRERDERLEKVRALLAMHGGEA